MHNFKKKLLHFTPIRNVHRMVQSFKSFLQGLPQIYYGTITKELLQGLINKPNPTAIKLFKLKNFFIPIRSSWSGFFKTNKE